MGRALHGDVRAGGGDAGGADVGLIVYNTYWTSLGLSSTLVEKLVDVPNVVSLKWSTPDNAMMTFEGIVQRYSKRFAIIDGTGEAGEVFERTLNALRDRAPELFA